VGNSISSRPRIRTDLRKLRIGEWTLDSDRVRLEQGSESRPLEPVDVSVLLHLVDAAPRLVDADDLLMRTWPDVVVGDNVLHRVITRLRKALGDSAREPRYIETVRKRGYRLLAPVSAIEAAEPTRKLAAPPGAGRSVAVLPFENFSGDREQDYLSAALHGELIAALARIGALDVRSRTSVCNLNTSEKSLVLIARELGVDTVVEGCVTRDREHMRITVTLIDGSSDTHLWNQSFTVPIDDAIGLQNELALKIAGAIRATLTPGERERLARAPTQNPDAYHAYLHAQVRRSEFLPGALEEAIAGYQRALEHDPDFAEAWAALSGALYMCACNIGAPPACEIMPRAKAAALRAIELDDSLADAHFALANVYFSYEWDWESAAREFDHARTLATGNDPIFSGFYANFLAAMGHADEAIATAREVVAHAPHDPLVRGNLVFVHAILGQHERALEEALAAAALAPDSFLLHLMINYIAPAAGDFASALKSRAWILEMLGQGDKLQELRDAYACGGAAGFAEFSLKHTLCGPHSPGQVPSLVELGRMDAAIAVLDRAVSVRDPYLVFMPGYPYIPPRLRADSRFDAVIRRIGLPARA
jgi:TolB-like protein